MSYAPQVPLHSAYLSGVERHEDQAVCLQLGLECGLDISAMIVSAVSIVRSGEAVDNVSSQNISILITNLVLTKYLGSG